MVNPPAGDDHAARPLILATSPGVLSYMATTNPTVTGAWTFLVADGDEFLLTLPQASQIVYVAIGGADDSDSDSAAEAPASDLLGHSLTPGADGLNRALIGPGPVFARLADPLGSTKVALNAWTPA